MDDPLAPGDRVGVARGAYRGRTVVVVRRVEGGAPAEAYEVMPEGEDRPQWFGRRSLVRLPAPPDPPGARSDPEVP